MGRSGASTAFSQVFRRRDFLVRSGLAGLGVGLGGTILSACGDDQSPSSGQMKDTLTIGMNYVTSNFEPKSTAALSDFIYLRFIYDTLVSVDSGSPEPWLAESWEAVGDATHWRFKLRRGVRFSNGEPFNSEAVRFTFQRALDDPETHWLARIQPLEKIQIIDDSTIDFHLGAPSAIGRPSPRLCGSFHRSTGQRRTPWSPSQSVLDRSPWTRSAPVRR